MLGKEQPVECCYIKKFIHIGEGVEGITASLKSQSPARDGIPGGIPAMAMKVLAT